MTKKHIVIVNINIGHTLKAGEIIIKPFQKSRHFYLNVFTFGK